MTELPPLPSNLKKLSIHLKFATKFDDTNPVIAFWCRLHANQIGFNKIMLEADTTLEEEYVFMSALNQMLADVYEKSEEELILHNDSAHAYFKKLVRYLFHNARTQDDAGIFDQKLVCTFFESTIFAEVLRAFDDNGELSEEFNMITKYATWKTCHLYTCLRDGVVPMSGIPEDLAIKIGFIKPEPDTDESSVPETLDMTQSSESITTTSNSNADEILDENLETSSTESQMFETSAEIAHSSQHTPDMVINEETQELEVDDFDEDYNYNPKRKLTESTSTPF